VGLGGAVIKVLGAGGNRHVAKAARKAKEVEQWTERKSKSSRFPGCREHSWCRGACAPQARVDDAALPRPLSYKGHQVLWRCLRSSACLGTVKPFVFMRNSSTAVIAIPDTCIKAACQTPTNPHTTPIEPRNGANLNHVVVSPCPDQSLVLHHQLNVGPVEGGCGDEGAGQAQALDDGRLYTGGRAGLS